MSEMRVDSEYLLRFFDVARREAFNSGRRLQSGVTQGVAYAAIGGELVRIRMGFSAMETLWRAYSDAWVAINTLTFRQFSAIPMAGWPKFSPSEEYVALALQVSELRRFARLRNRREQQSRRLWGFSYGLDLMDHEEIGKIKRRQRQDGVRPHE